MVVVRRYTNTPYIPQGSSHLPYLDMNTLSGGTSSNQFPLDGLCLHRLLPFSDTEVVLSQEEGEMEFKVFPHFQEALWQSSEDKHCLSDLISLSIPLSAPHPYQEEGTQTEGDSGFYPSLKLLQDGNQARGKLKGELDQETQELA